MELLMNDDVHLATVANGYKGWRKINQYVVWAKEYDPSEPNLTVLEMTGKGVIAIDSGNNYLMHRIPAGTPVHITGLFGFWHKSDADRIWISANYPNKSKHYAIISGGNLGVNSINIVSWYCPKCANELARFEEENPDYGVDFWNNVGTYVDEFNKDEAMRTCSKCGHVHPLAYPFVQDDDQLHDGINKW